MYPFPDYYVQFDIRLAQAPFASLVPLRYDMYAEASSIIILTLLLGIEIWTSIGQIFIDSIRTKKSLDNVDFFQAMYTQSMEISSTGLNTTSPLDTEVNAETTRLLHTTARHLIRRE
jgi:hypothetical protein